jgi:hypothetical protein
LLLPLQIQSQPAAQRFLTAHAIHRLLHLPVAAVLEVDYGFRFQAYPNLRRGRDPITPEGAAKASAGGALGLAPPSGLAAPVRAVTPVVPPARTAAAAPSPVAVQKAGTRGALSGRRPGWSSFGCPWCAGGG